MVRSKNKGRKNKRRSKGVCLWNNIEIIFDLAKSGVGERKLNKLDFRVLSASCELKALRRRGINGVGILDILNRDGCSRRVGEAELKRHQRELREAIKDTSSKRPETHTIEVPRWIMVGLSCGKFTVARGIALLFYLYRRLVKTKSHYKNWIKTGQAYGRFKLSDLKDWCGIHLSRASEALKWLKQVGILERAWVPFFERMKRGNCFVDGFLMKENGNSFGRNRKSLSWKPKNHKTYKGTKKERVIFRFAEDECGRLVACKA